MEIDLGTLEARHAHDLMTSCIIPRPIAWVSSIGSDGEINLAPFSFFTGVSWSPPVLAFSVVNRADGTMKDTAVNIRRTKEFVVNIVSTGLLKMMESSARPIPYGEDLASIEGIHLEPCQTVKPCRIREAPACYECRLEKIVTLGEGPNTANLILGRVLLMHVRDDLLVNGREVDWRGLDALGRLSGSRYCTIDSVIESDTN